MGQLHEAKIFKNRYLKIIKVLIGCMKAEQRHVGISY